MPAVVPPTPPRDEGAASGDPLDSSHSRGRSGDKRASKSVGIFAALPHPSLKLQDETNESDAESTSVGSDRDVIDLTDTSEGEWTNVQEVERTMEI